MPKLIPARFMNKGSKGPAVAALQIFLLGAKCNPRIVVDGDYGEETASGVSMLQYKLGFPTSERDGNFGPETRMGVRRVYGLDFDGILESTFEGETEVVLP